MSTKDTYLAGYLGSKTSPRRAAWQAWVAQHEGAIVAMGGPLGKTKKVGPRGIEDVANAMAAFTVVRAASHAEAARLFERHPHFSIFPGDAVEVMPVMPIPGREERR